MNLQPLIINRQYWKQMRTYVNSIYPEEACGLLAGINNRVSSVFSVKNVLKSPHHYRMDAQEQLTCFLTIEQYHWDLLGIYHSHPQGPPYPSQTDLAEAYYPDTAYLIWALDEQEWGCQAFMLKNLEVTPLKILIEEEI